MQLSSHWRGKRKKQTKKKQTLLHTVVFLTPLLPQKVRTVGTKELFSSKAGALIYMEA